MFFATSCLKYLYGEEVGEGGYKSHAKELIEAADWYALVHLKLEAEAWYVKATQTNFDNMMELLHYSDSKNLALLKEAAMEFVADNGDNILQKVSLKDSPGGALADLLAAVLREKKKKATVTPTPATSARCASAICARGSTRRGWASTSQGRR